MKPVFAWLVAALATMGLSVTSPTSAWAEVYPPCSPTIHVVTDSLRTSLGTSSSASATAAAIGGLVLGLSDPNQVYTMAPDAKLQGDVFLFNSASLLVTGRAQIAGNVYLVDHAALRVTGADLTIPNTHAVQYRWLATDDATVEISDSRVKLGSESGVYNRHVFCGRSRATIQRSDFTLTDGSTEALFAWDTATVSLTSSLGNFELSVDHGGQVNVTDQHQAPNGHTVVYFSVRSSLSTPVKLVSGAGVSQSIAFPRDALGRVMRAEVQRSDILFALRIDPGAAVSLVDSSLALLLTSSGGSSMHNLAPGHVANQTVNLGDRSISLANTDVWLWSAYLDGPSGALDLTDAWLGELICTSSSTAICHGQRVVIDGTGGYVSATGRAQLDLDSSLVSTYLTALDHSIIRLDESMIVLPPAASGRLTPWIQSSQDSLVVLENSGFDPAVWLVTTEHGAIANATLENPTDGMVLGRDSLAIRGTAAVRSASNSPNAFVSYTLNSTPAGGGQSTRIGGGTTQIQSNVLGTWDTTTLAAGAYDVHLVLTGASGMIADVTRRVTLS